MATISIETKKFGDFTAITDAPNSGVILVHDGNGVKKITVADFKDVLAYHNAGTHNSLYRGKYLGDHVTAEQWAAIDAGTFEGLYIGDYWVINGVTWRIAAFDYYLNTGDVNCTTHHVVIVPDTILDSQKMNDTNITTGGYTGSKMYTDYMGTAKATIKSAFGASHILSHRQFLVNAVTNGRPSGAEWVDSEIELMNEINIYGCSILGVANDGSSIPTVYTIDKEQFPLFRLNPAKLNIRQTYWVRDVVTASYFALVNNYGRATNDGASSALGVRPAFSIKS